MPTFPDYLPAIRERLALFKYVELKELADECGVPAGTLAKIKYGKVENPRIDTVRKLYDHFFAASAV